MVQVFHADNYLLPERMGVCAYMSEASTVMHTHDYYELFLVEKGCTQHNTISDCRTIEPGTLCFIRPHDSHHFIGNHCSIFNLLIRSELWLQILDFIGPNPTVEHMLSSTVPICINLMQEDFVATKHMLEANILIPFETTDCYNSHLKVLVLSLLERFFAQPLRQTEEFPLWLDSLLKEMHNQENYADGMNAMYRISGYSPEHLCRCFQRYLGITPTSYLNTLRIQEAGRFLVYTDDSIINIASRCGFNSLSHFYHQFKRIYKLSPTQYRVSHKLQRSGNMGQNGF